MEIYITSYCKIAGNKIIVDGNLIFEMEKEIHFNAFLSAAYKHLELKYPKFHKMDRLCKLAMLTSEPIIQTLAEIDAETKKNGALVFANAASSLDTDRSHAGTISDKQNYFPSPSVFVYTLPNIMLGEIAIKHKISGENAFFISPEFDPTLFYNYNEILLNSTQTSFVLAGWIDVDSSNSEGFVYCLKKSNFKVKNNIDPLLHSAENLRQLYKT